MEQKHNELIELANRMDNMTELLSHVLLMQKTLAAYCRVLAENNAGGTPQNPTQQAALEIPDDWDYIHGTHPMPNPQQAIQ